MINSLKMEDFDFDIPFKEETGNEDYILSFLRKNKVETKEIPPVGELKISVKTACCYIDKQYDIKKLCVEVDNLLKNRNKIDKDGFRIGKKTRIQEIRYTKEDDQILVKNSKKNKNFFNSVNIKVNVRENKDINLMIFTNGRITCTGSLYDSDGLDAANILLDEMKKMKGVFEDEKEKMEAKVINYEIVMINSNFFVGFFIDNHKLYKILLDNRDEYNLFVDYEPSNYQGVKIHYMWNENQGEKNGVCCCKEKKCRSNTKKRGGKGEGDCRKISVAIFTTGKVLIAGAKSDEQLRDSYNFVTKLLQSLYSDIVQQSVDDNKEFIDRCVKNTSLVRKMKITSGESKLHG